MDFMNGCRVRKARLATIGCLIVGTTIYATAAAETIFTVNGVDVDSAVVDSYFESRLQGNQATAEQRETLITELKDVYLLSTGDRAEQFAADPKIAAQIELQRRGAIAQAVAGSFFENVKVSEEETSAAYDKTVKEWPPLQFKARHILVESQGEAAAVVAQLDDGADFEALAKDKSTGPTAPNGGDLGWFSPDRMVPTFSNAVEAMENGKYTTDPVQTQFGWHVILREDSRDNPPPTFESIRDDLTREVQQNKFQAHLATLRKASAE